MSAPSWTLPACPCCSSRIHLYRPRWLVARHTSEREKKISYMLIGCPHVAQICDPLKLRKPEELAAIENQWTARAAELFQTYTANWTAREKEEFQRVLDGAYFLPATTIELSKVEANNPSPLPKRFSAALGS